MLQKRQVNKTALMRVLLFVACKLSILSLGFAPKQSISIGQQWISIDPMLNVTQIIQMFNNGFDLIYTRYLIFVKLLVIVNIYFKLYPSIYCLMQGNCFIKLQQLLNFIYISLKIRITTFKYYNTHLAACYIILIISDIPEIIQKRCSVPSKCFLSNSVCSVLIKQ